MILQILIFILVKLPKKVMRKAKQYAKRFRPRKKIAEISVYDGEDSFTIKDLWPLEGVDEFGCCIDEIENVMEEFSRRGLFAFGSFWGGELASSSSSTTCPSCLKDEDLASEA